MSPGEHWVGTWATAPQPHLGEPSEYSGQTLRLIVHTSLGGDAVRVRLSNVFGAAPIEIGGVHVAVQDEGRATKEEMGHRLTWLGRSLFAIPNGESVLTDAAELEVGARSDLAVSISLPKPTRIDTEHFLALQTSFVLPGSESITTWPLLTAVDVRTPTRAAAIVALGDSFADGAASTVDANRRWPDLLATRLQSDDETAGLSVLNAGIIGNRLLFHGPDGRAFHGAAAISRFERDVLGQTGVASVIVQLGLNDIGFPGSVTPADEAVTADQLIAGLRRLIDRAHERGVQVIGATISPFANAISAESFYTTEKDGVREAFNAWMRSSHELDGIADFDQALRDSELPSTLRPAFDSGDRMHPNDLGHQAMADAIDLAMLKRLSSQPGR